MLSFFGEQCLRDAVVERVREHQRLDQIAQRIYWDGSKGCAIGCVLHSDEHMAFERQLGIPVFLAYMDEHIFEHLPLEEAKAWPLRLIEAVPVGVDLELVFPRFMHWLLSDPKGMRQYADARTMPIIESLVTLYARRIEGIPFDADAAKAATMATMAARAAEAAAWAAVMVAGPDGPDGPVEAVRSDEAAAWAAARVAEAAEAAAWAAGAAAKASAWAAVIMAARAAGATMAARAAGADGAAGIRRQADYLITLLHSYESQPILVLAPCQERLSLNATNAERCL